MQSGVSFAALTGWSMLCYALTVFSWGVGVANAAVSICHVCGRIELLVCFLFVIGFGQARDYQCVCRLGHAILLLNGFDQWSSPHWAGNSVHRIFYSPKYLLPVQMQYMLRPVQHRQLVSARHSF
jgi:hypothetical protein